MWVGGSSVGDGEKVLEAVQKAFFGPFHVSVMLDSNGCNTTAARRSRGSPRRST